MSAQPNIRCCGLNFWLWTIRMQFLAEIKRRLITMLSLRQERRGGGIKLWNDFLNKKMRSNFSQIIIKRRRQRLMKIRTGADLINALAAIFKPAWVLISAAAFFYSYKKVKRLFFLPRLLKDFVGKYSEKQRYEMLRKMVFIKSCNNYKIGRCFKKEQKEVLEVIKNFEVLSP